MIDLMSNSKNQDYKVLDEINTLRQEIKSLQKSMALLRQDILRGRKSK